jgi:HTH-type transcriptional regulator/antitoxin HigA
MSLSNPDITSAVAHWPELADAVFVPHSEADYLRLVAVLDRLIDEVGEDESHPLASLMEVLGVLIERYEAEQVPELGSDNER